MNFIFKIKHHCVCSTFAKAHEYKCEYINKDGIKCNGMPKLGEITQVCVT